MPIRFVTWGEAAVAGGLAGLGAEVAEARPADFAAADDAAWMALCGCVGWFHLSLTAAAGSAEAARLAKAAVLAACAEESTVSLEVRFDPAGWGWDAAADPRDEAEATLRRLLPLIDILIANETDLPRLLGLPAEMTGTVRVEDYCDAAAQLADAYPNLQYIVITLRETRAAGDTWGAMFYDVDGLMACTAPVNADLEFSPGVLPAGDDAAGRADRFTAGVIFALAQAGLDEPETAIRFAVAAADLPPGADRAAVERAMGAPVNPSSGSAA